MFRLTVLYWDAKEIELFLQVAPVENFERNTVSTYWFKILTHNLWRFYLFDISKYLYSSFCLGKCALMRYSVQVEMYDCLYIMCRRQWFLIYKAQPSLIVWAFLQRSVNILILLNKSIYIYLISKYPYDWWKCFVGSTVGVCRSLIHT